MIILWSDYTCCMESGHVTSVPILPCRTMAMYMLYQHRSQLFKCVRVWVNIFTERLEHLHLLRSVECVPRFASVVTGAAQVSPDGAMRYSIAPRHMLVPSSMASHVDCPEKRIHVCHACKLAHATTVTTDSIGLTQLTVGQAVLEALGALGCSQRSIAIVPCAKHCHLFYQLGYR